LLALGYENKVDSVMVNDPTCINKTCYQHVQGDIIEMYNQFIFLHNKTRCQWISSLRWRYQSQVNFDYT